jgi:hypothetical protein
VAHRGEELALRAAGLLGGPLGLEELPRLVQQLPDVALRFGVQAGVLERDEQRQPDGRAQREQHAGPRPGLEAGGFGLGREDARVDRRHQPVEILLDRLGVRTRFGIRERERLRAGAAAHEILLRGNDAAIALERRPRLGELLALALALRILREALEILGDAVRPLVPRRRVAGIAHDHRPLLELDERRDRLAGGRGQTDGGNGAGRDLAVDGDEIADGVKAQIADHRQHDDHEQ